MKRGPAPSLIGMAELHDLSLAYQIGPLLSLLSAEAELIPDLLSARPWLTEMNAQALLETLLEQEWSGFVARLGRVGPWVFAPSVADLQALSGAYARLVEQASGSDLTGSEPASLLGRLWGSGELSGGEPAIRKPAIRAPAIRAPAAEAEDPERAFWTLARTRALRQRQAWADRRGIT
ncbi:hypothetical protein [Deinococcus sp.]|uniref:hypothetical protein n=1 Tax=Deinococcus sp. TaxID=47478 RepID=UPI003C7A0001